MDQRRQAFLTLLSLAVAACTVTCAGTAGTPSPATVIISISPTSANVFLGATQAFSATVSNASTSAVTWAVNGVLGGNTTVGTISVTGSYTAPQNLPAPPSVTITATSQADPTKSASAAVTIQSDLAVSVMPAPASVELGASMQFLATVAGSGNPNRVVTWSVNGIAGGNAEVGTISTTGGYTAPQILPSVSITVTATSVADSTKSANATVTITSNLTVSVSGPSTLPNGATAQFAATVTPAPNSNPSLDVTWSVNGIAGGNSTVGTIDGAGLFHAPVVAPSPPSVSVAASSVADPAKSASVSVTITALLTVFITPEAATVELGKSVQFSVTVGGTTDQRIIWSVNGVVGGDPTVGTITNTVTNPGLYTAPVNLPSANEVTVRATSQADSSVSATALVTLFSSITVSVSPSASTRAVNRKQTFTATVANTTNTAVEWRVNGIVGGDTTVGRICIFGLAGCQPISTGNTVDYQAPASVPSPDQVLIEAVSQADSSRRGNAVVTVIANLVVTVSPASVTVPAGGTQQFTAAVLGTADQRVTWSVAGNSCNNGPCGSISSTGLYAAPASVSGAATDTVIATSVEDTTRSGSAAVTVGTGPFLRTLRPSSLTAGATNIVLRVLGNNFVASSPGPGSVIVFAGADAATTCIAATSGFECTTTLDAAQLSTAADKTVQVRNPDGVLSNSVGFVLVAATSDEEVIRLDVGSPAAASKNVIVVDHSALGANAPALSLEAIGIIDPVAGTCSLRGTPLVIDRPTSGTRDVRLCLAGNGLSATDTYSLSGPVPNDIFVGPTQVLGGGIFEVTLTLSATTQSGPRTLFVRNANRDLATASGAIEVK